VYTKCLNCTATTIIPNVSLRDDAGGYSAADHRITIERNPTALLKREPISAQTRVYICGTCGYIALFVETPARLYEAYQHAQEQRAHQRERDQKLSRLIEPTLGGG
jgi:hypothetical protein